MQLYFKEFGRGEPLVMLHGLFGSSDNFLGVAKNLAEKFHVYLLDLRNHGQSPHSDEMSHSILAGDVFEFLNSQKLPEVFLLGHSLGGKVAMQFALEFPECVPKLIVADIAPRAYPPLHEEIFQTLLALNLQNFSSRTDMETAIAPQIPNLNLRRFLLKNVGRNPDATFFWKNNLRGLHENYPQLCAAISSAQPFERPVLFVRAEKSGYICGEDLPLIKTLFPRMKIDTLAGANHWLHADQPQEFARHVIKFLSCQFAD